MLALPGHTSEQRTLSKTQNNHLTGKAPYKFESMSLHRRVCKPACRDRYRFAASCVRKRHIGCSYSNCCRCAWRLLRSNGRTSDCCERARIVVFPAELRSAPRTGGSIVEPEVLVTKAVVDAVNHDGHPLYLRVTARCLPRVEDDRTGAVLGQPPFDLPHQLLALLLVGLRRLPVDQLVEFGIAITRVVALCRTDVVLIELLVRVIDGAFADV